MSTKTKISTKFAITFVAYLLTNATIGYADVQAVPYHPRLFGWGSASDNGYLEGDAMVPVFGNQDGFLYIDGDGRYGVHNSWLGSAGLGFRAVHNNHILFGAYAFADRNRTLFSDNFWVFNPGLEIMSNRWDANVNGYFPLGKREKTTGIFFGDQLGVSTGVHFSGHSEVDNLIALQNQIGTGADAEIGRTFPALGYARLYLGGYYFHLPNTGNMGGVQGGITMSLTQHVALELNDSYDSLQHNEATIRLRVMLGGIPKNLPPDVHNRLLDPIERHLGTLENGSGAISTQSLKDTGILAAEQNNIWFFTQQSNGTAFDPANGSNNCTFEHPCSGPYFNQTDVNTINGIAPDTVFYFASGPGGTSYSIINGGTALTINNGQSMYGRTLDFSLPAPATGRPLFIGGLNLLGNNTISDANFTGVGDPSQTRASSRSGSPPPATSRRAGGKCRGSPAGTRASTPAPGRRSRGRAPVSPRPA